jgi:hypothetical protein
MKPILERPGGTARDVAQCPEVAAILEKYNQWVAAQGYPSANYIIITLYNNGQDCIPEHSDKTIDFDENSIVYSIV